ncbi:hypothetical protein EDB19DRAFT_1828369 [Suillus lakei]|nr:hypothetical protein EDB19DRAFT_1828369 [Suillus lakei]
MLLRTTLMSLMSGLALWTMSMKIFCLVPSLTFPPVMGQNLSKSIRLVDVNSSVKTLVNIDIDPTSGFKCYTARKLRAASTTVYYFRTLSEAKEHCQTAFNAWCSEAV